MAAGLVPRLLAGWRAPRATVRGLRGLSEPGLLAMLFGTMAVYLLAQWPGHARDAQLDPSVPLDARMGGALMATMFLLPLILYGVAAAVAALSRLARWRVAGPDSRLALFWALALVAPLMVLAGLVRGLIGPSPALSVTTAAAGLAFVVFWAQHLRALAMRDG